MILAPVSSELQTRCAATLAVGSRASQFARTLAASYTLREKSIPLYILTTVDDAYHFEPDPIKLQLQFPLVHLLPFRSTDAMLGAATVEVAAAAAAMSNAHMRVKLVKTQLLRLLRSQQCRQILWIDSDVVIGAPLSPIYDQCAALLRAGQHQLALYPDIGVSKAPYHTGVVCMHDGVSDALLTRWAELIAGGTFRRDQWALAETVKGKRNPLQIGLLPLHSKDGNHFTFMNGTVFASTDAYTFLHATHYRMLDPPRWNYTTASATEYYRHILGVPFDYTFLEDEED